MAHLRGGVFTLVAFVSRPIMIRVIFVIISIHHFLQFNVYSFAAFVKLTQKKLYLKTLCFELLFGAPLLKLKPLFNVQLNNLI